MRWFCGTIIFLISAGAGLAQDQPNPDQLRAMYDEALQQLKAAQDRKSELATENESLLVKIAELEKQMAQMQAIRDDLQKQVAQNSEKSYYYRAHYAAWREFTRQYPSVLTRWKIFLEHGLQFPPPEMPQWIDTDWPLSAEG